MRAVPLAHQHGNTREHAAKPGKAVAKPVQERHRDVERVMPSGPANHAQCVLQFAHILQLVPYLRANHARDHHQRHHVQRVRIHTVADKVLVQHNRTGHRRQPQQQPERAKCMGPRFR